MEHDYDIFVGKAAHIYSDGVFRRLYAPRHPSPNDLLPCLDNNFNFYSDPSPHWGLSVGRFSIKLFEYSIQVVLTAADLVDNILRKFSKFEEYIAYQQKESGFERNH